MTKGELKARSVSIVALVDIYKESNIFNGNEEFVSMGNVWVAKQDLFKTVKKLDEIDGFLHEEHYEPIWNELIGKIKKWFGEPDSCNKTNKEKE